VAAILTCMEKPVPADAFRPSYCDRGQKIYLARNLKRELLYTLPKTKSAPASLAQWHRVFQRPWLDTVMWGYASPKENMPRYGLWITHAASMASLLLHMDYTAADKEPLLVHYVQYGIDLWGITRAGFEGWMGHGGFGQGRKWTLIFSGMMLGDDAMASPNRDYPKTFFGEDTQTAFGKCWTGADVVFLSHARGRSTAKDSPELKPPSEWHNTLNSEGYRRCCTSVEWVGQAVAAHLMLAEKLWDHDAFFAYVDRWMTEDTLKFAKEIKQENSSYPEWMLKSLRRCDPLMQEMWDKYRNNLPPARDSAATTRKASGDKKE
jgi:hypothetical protein